MTAAVDAYLASLPDDRRRAMTQLRDVINTNLPAGFEECIGYTMPSWVVPHTLYPAGYHCDPKLPLPFLSIASQKSHIGFYHMGLYADADLLAWFQAAWPDHVKTKLDMGKSCIRLKKVDTIPYDLLGQLCTKMTPRNWIDRYEAAFRKG